MSNFEFGRVLGGGRRIAVIGHHGRANIGDEAIVEALVDRLRTRLPAAELIGFSMDPEDTARRLGIEVYPVRFDAQPLRLPEAPAAPATRTQTKRADWVARLRAQLRWLTWLGAALLSAPARIRYLIRCQRHLRRTDLIIFAGSNQLIDQFGGARGFPLTLARWALQGRLAGARIAFASMGAGPLEGKQARRLVRWALQRADYISLRDHHSRRLIAALLDRAAPLELAPDLAFGHPELERLDAQARAPRVHPIIAINVMPVNHPGYWPDADPAAYERYVESFARVADLLVAQGLRVKFFASQAADTLVAEDVMARTGAAASPYLDRPRNAAELICAITAADVVIATRYHGIALSIACAKPVIAICYHEKSRELMADAGLGAFALPIDPLDPQACVQRVQDALAQSNELGAALHGYAARQAERADAQIDRLLALTGSRTLATTALHVGAGSRFDERGAPARSPDPKAPLEPGVERLHR